MAVLAWAGSMFSMMDEEGRLGPDLFAARMLTLLGIDIGSFRSSEGTC